MRKERKSYSKHALYKRLIQHRPIEILQRNTIGHWEGDTLQFLKQYPACVTTLVERKSRFVCLHKNEDKKSIPLMKTIANAIENAPKKLWQTITFDQGSEFMAVSHIERETACKVYFCEPRSPWQRGSNENMNGRLRRYLPNNIDVGKISPRELDNIAWRVNNTPRKCLGYYTPREILKQHFPAACRTPL